MKEKSNLLKQKNNLHPGNNGKIKRLAFQKHLQRSDKRKKKWKMKTWKDKCKKMHKRGRKQETNN